MKFKLFVSLFTGILLTISCNSVDANQEYPDTPAQLDVPEMVMQLNTTGSHFGLSLFRETASTEAGNFMLSPLSAQVALTMLMNGAREETYNQIHDMLGYPSDWNITEVNQAYRSLASALLQADPQVALALANAVFYREHYQVKAPFLSAMQQDFGAHIQSLNFSSPQALGIINGWAADNTHQRIPEVLDVIPNNAVMFLMNALYFKGNWSTMFDASKTAPSSFRLADGSTVQVPVMNGNIASLTYYGDGFRAIEIPYGRKNFSMVIMVPEAGLPSFLNGFDGDAWLALTRSLDAATPENHEWPQQLVGLPRFGFEYEKILNDQLKALGMTDAFDDGLANLTGIADDQLVVSFVKQNTFVEVNEEGTEAAAVTTIGIIRTSTPTPFMVDRPFVFAIRERTTNTLLFMGQVADPRP